MYLSRSLSSKRLTESEIVVDKAYWSDKPSKILSRYTLSEETLLHMYQRVSTLYVPTCPLSLNKCNSSELSNAAALSPFGNITWSMSVSKHDNTLKCGKIHRYSDIPHPTILGPISNTCPDVYE